ncbi:MAG: dockerin type I domain-containing protein [Armatimonadetes bacterium]|nr:dockerin type I domain-containing protein [Armatimonadota bacterium]
MTHGQRVALIALTAWLHLSWNPMAAGRAQAQAPPPPPYMGDYDVNGDGRIDDSDLAEFRTHWINAHKTTPIYNSRADFNSDGKIDLTDARGLIEEWLRYYTTYHSAQVPVGEALARQLAAFERVARAAVKQSAAKSPAEAVARTASR